MIVVWLLMVSGVRVRLSATTLKQNQHEYKTEEHISGLNLPNVFVPLHSNPLLTGVEYL